MPRVHASENSDPNGDETQVIGEKDPEENIWSGGQRLRIKEKR